jgi:hypothetical protein
MSRTVPPRIVALLGLLTALSASAQPYEYLAIYEPITGSGDAHVIRLDAAKDTLLPDGGERHQLDRIVVRFKSDGVSLSTLSAFSQLRFELKLGDGAPVVVTVPEDGIEKLPNREATLMRWHGDGNRDALARVNISVQSIYSKQFLCLQELLLLEESSTKKGRTTWIHVPQAASTPAGGEQAQKAKPASGATTVPTIATPPTSGTRRVVRASEDDPWLLYSFCEHGESFQWSTLATALKVPAAAAPNPAPAAAAPNPARVFAFGQEEVDTNDKKLLTAHKQGLSDLIVDQLNTRFSSLGTSAVDKENVKYNKALIYVRDAHSFSVIKSAGSLMLVEESGGKVDRLADLIDQDSEVALALDQQVCFQLPPGEMMKTPWTFELEVPDKTDKTKTQKVGIDLDFRHGCRRQLLTRWSDYLDQRVTFRIIYRVPQREDIVVFKDSFQVYNLGLITTAPVFTEVIAAYKSASPRDIEAKSKIPVSWALSVREGQRDSYAVTFPFTIGVNTRDFPNLAKYVSLAPSVSLLAGGGVAEDGGEDPDVRVAFGVGVNLAEAFHFGYAWTPAGGGGRYVLIGVSVPDLLPLLEKP